MKACVPRQERCFGDSKVMTFGTIVTWDSRSSKAGRSRKKIHADTFCTPSNRAPQTWMQLTLGLAKRILDQHAGELGECRTHVAAEARDLSALLVRLLASRRSDANLRGEALDSIDRLVEAGAWGVTDSLAAAERLSARAVSRTVQTAPRTQAGQGLPGCASREALQAGPLSGKD